MITFNIFCKFRNYARFVYKYLSWYLDITLDKMHMYSISRVYRKNRKNTWNKYYRIMFQNGTNVCVTSIER